MLYDYLIGVHGRESLRENGKALKRLGIIIWNDSRCFLGNLLLFFQRLLGG